MKESKEQIPIRNIYYMLSYAYKTLHFSEYKSIGSETFENVMDLYSGILVMGIPVLIRGGLIKDYVQVDEKTAVIRGKIDINASIKKNALVDKKLVVIYDEFSEDVLLNQIIKATLIYLSRSNKIDKVKRRHFYSLLPYFTEVSDVELRTNPWKRVQYNSQNVRYQFLIDICRFLYEELLVSEGEEISNQNVEDEQPLSSLYEKFIYAFYQRETGYKVTRPHITWNVDNHYSEALPIMETDIVLQRQNKTLIIDTKFYSTNMATKFEGGISKQKSENLYQIFTYVNNWKPKKNEVVGGMLLYARTIAGDQPNHHYQINGNKISVLNLNLNQSFESIKEDLIKYADEYFIGFSTCHFS